MKLRVGLIGYGKAGTAVANVLSNDPRFELCWIAKRSDIAGQKTHPETGIPVFGMEKNVFSDLFERIPVDALIDFSSPKSIYAYGEEVRKRGIILVQQRRHV